MQSHNSNASSPFYTAIHTEFLEDSHIAKKVFDGAITLLPDLEINPLTQEIESAPLYEALGWTYTRFTQQAKPELLGAAFYQESGELWQVKVFGQNNNDRSGNYYAPKGIGDVPYLPPVPRAIQEQIATTYGLNPPAIGESFWDWLESHPVIPITFTEGGKKALRAISEGQAAIALYGCLCGAKGKDENGFPTRLHLTPELERFAKNGRQINIALDQDNKPKAKKAVTKGIRSLARAIANAGGKPYVIFWNRKTGKGLDDLSAMAYQQAINGAIPFEKWRLRKYTCPSLFDPIEVHTPRVDEFLENHPMITPEVRIVFLKSPKKTYKTEFLSRMAQLANSEGRAVISLTHREQLGQQLGDRLGIEYRGELTKVGKLMGYSLCINSCHPHANPPFNPQDWIGADLHLDEADQVFFDLLNGSHLEQVRTAVLQTLRELVRVIVSTGGRIYVSSADLSAIEIQFLLDMIGFPVEYRFFENTYKPNEGNRFLHHYETPEALVAKIYNCINRKERLMIHCGAQKIRGNARGLLSTKNLEQTLRNKFPGIKLIRVDSETVNDPTHPAFACMKGNKLETLLAKYPIMITSPIIETGISIAAPIDQVFFIGSGVQTVEAACQTIERVRCDAPRHVYAPVKGLNFIGNRSTDDYELKRDENQLSNLNKTLAHIDYILSEEDKNPETLDAWAKRAAVVNYGMWHYRESILEKLLAEGYTLVAPSPDSPTDKPTKKKLSKTKAKAKGYKSQQSNSDSPSQKSSTSSLTTEPTPVLPEKVSAVSSFVEILPDADLEESLTNAEIREELKFNCQEQYQTYCESVANQTVSQEDLQMLQNKRTRTEEELHKERKANLSKRYVTQEVSADLVEKDDQGWYGKLRLHYFLTIGNCFLSARDQKAIQRLGEASVSKPGEKIKVFSPDQNRNQLVSKIALLQLLQIHQFLDTESQWHNENLQEWFETFIVPNRYQIKLILGININPDKDKAIAVAQRLLRLLDLKMTYVGRLGSRGDRRRIYQGCSIDSDGRQAIFERWSFRDGGNLSLELSA